MLMKCLILDSGRFSKDDEEANILRILSYFEVNRSIIIALCVEGSQQSDR